MTIRGRHQSLSVTIDQVSGCASPLGEFKMKAGL